MEIVIKILDETYDGIMSDTYRNLDHYERLIANGIPLPKGHGRLIDEQSLVDIIERMWKNREITNTKYNTFLSILNYVPTITEADKE